jgi:hypothetical protein
MPMINKLPLTQNDLESLARSFITPELAEKARLFRVDDLEGSELFGKKRKKGVDWAGIIFSYESQIVCAIARL